MRAKRKKTLEEQSTNRKDALKLLHVGNKTYRQIANLTDVPRSTLSRLKKASENGPEELRKLLSKDCKPGRKPVLNKAEINLLKDEIKESEKLGYAVDKDDVKHIMSRIAKDGRNRIWKMGVPSEETIRRFRSSNRDITYRKVENKTYAKLNAENYEHVMTFFNVMKSVEKRHPGITTDPNRIYNVDETDVDGTNPKIVKAFTSSSSRSGGCRGTNATNGMSRHITPVISICANGTMAPPYFIVARKRQSDLWQAPVNGVLLEGCSDPDVLRFTNEGWFSDNGVIKCTKKGSVESSILPSIIKHIKNHARKFVHIDKWINVVLDGHSSRKGIEWVEECVRKNIEAVVNASDTSHFLQSCDDLVNLLFKTYCKEMRDTFIRSGKFDTRYIAFNLACAVYALEKISKQNIIDSFQNTGIYPLDPSLADRFKSAQELTNDEVEAIDPTSRKSDEQIKNEVIEILTNDDDVCKQLTNVLNTLNKAEIVSNIVEAPRELRKKINLMHRIKQTGKALSFGTDAECVTLKEALYRRKAEQMAKEAERKKKEDAKLKKAELKQKREEQKNLDKEEKERKLVEKKRDKEIEKSKKRRATEVKAADAQAKKKAKTEFDRIVKCCKSFRLSYVSTARGIKKRSGLVGSFKLTVELLLSIVDDCADIAERVNDDDNARLFVNSVLYREGTARRMLNIPSDEHDESSGYAVTFVGDVGDEELCGEEEHRAEDGSDDDDEDEDGD